MGDRHAVAGSRPRIGCRGGRPRVRRRLGGRAGSSPTSTRTTSPRSGSRPGSASSRRRAPSTVRSSGSRATASAAGEVPGSAVTGDGTLARRLGLRDAVVIGLGSMIGAGVFAAFSPAADAAGSALLLGSGDRGRGGLRECHVLGSAGRHVPRVRGHLRVRAGTTGPVLGVPGRLGLRRRQDSQLCRDGAHRRVLRRPAARRPRRCRGRGRAHRPELHRGAEERDR